MPTLSGTCLSVSFADGPRVSRVLCGAEIELDCGKIYSVAGRSGSGKTTLLRALLGLRMANATEWGGDVLLDQVPVRGSDAFARLRRDRVVYVSQAADLVQFLTVLENLRLSEVLGGERVSEENCFSALDQLGVAALANRLPSQLSGGERQRCAIARTLVRPELILMVDEPTSALDDESAVLVLQALSVVRDRGAAVLVTTHDRRIADLSDVNMVLEGGFLKCGGY